MVAMASPLGKLCFCGCRVGGETWLSPIDCVATVLDGGLGVARALGRHLDGKMPELFTESGHYFMVCNNSLGP